MFTTKSQKRIKNRHNIPQHQLFVGIQPAKEQSLLDITPKNVIIKTFKGIKNILKKPAITAGFTFLVQKILNFDTNFGTNYNLYLYPCITAGVLK